MTSLALTLVLCAALGAHPHKLDVPSAVREARKAIALGDFSKALKLLGEADVRGASPAELEKLKVTKAVAHSALGERDEAVDDLADALQHNPELTLEESDESPAVTSALERARQRVQGGLDVKANVPAKAFVDGDPLGPVPLTTQLPVGAHTVELQDAHGQRKRQDVVVRFGETTEVTVKFEPPAPKVSGAEREGPPAQNVAPPGAEVAAPSGGRRALGYSLLAGGVVLAGAGAYEVLSAQSVYRAWLRQQTPDAPLTVTRAQAHQAALVSPIAAGAAAVGLALGALGVYELLTPHVSVAPASSGGAMAQVEGAF